MLMPTKILVPTDFSEYSDRALGQALDIAVHYSAKVFLVHVVHENIHRASFEFTLPDEVVRKIRDSTAAWVKTSFAEQLARFPRAKDVEVTTDIREGIPYEEILKEGKERGIDLIVIASLGRSGIGKYFIGSVARNVLKGSKCPVLLTK